MALKFGGIKATTLELPSLEQGPVFGLMSFSMAILGIDAAGAGDTVDITAFEARIEIAFYRPTVNFSKRRPIDSVWVT